jgi:hypothetical protein
MTQSGRILLLTRAAFLCGIALALAGFQSLVPGSFLLLLWSAPAVFAMLVLVVPLSIALWVGVVVILVTTISFGLVNGFWLASYWIIGLFCGIFMRHKCHVNFVRVFVFLLYNICIIVAVLLFGLITQIDWGKVAGFAFQPLVLGGGLIVWSVINTISVLSLIQQFINQSGGAQLYEWGDRGERGKQESS